MKKVIFLLLLTFFTTSSFSQNETDKLKLQKDRLMLHNVAIYLRNVNQGSIDIDSAMILACKAHKLPYTLANDEGFNDASNFPGNNLITNNYVRGAELLLPRLNTTDQIKLALQIGSFYLFKAGAKKDDLKNALLYINKAQKLAEKYEIQKWRFQSKYLLAKYYYQAGKPQLSGTIFSQLVNAARKTQNEKILAEAIDNQGTFMPDNNKEKATILSEALAIYKKTGNKEKEIETYMKIIPVHFWTGNMKLAKQELLTSLSLQKKIGFLYTQYTETTISHIELFHNNLKDALYYALESVSSMEKTKDYAFADSFYIRLGNIYSSTGYYEDAIKFYLKGIEYNQRELNTGTWHKSFFGAVRSLMDASKYTQALQYLENNSKKYPPKNDLDNMILNQLKACCYDQLGRLKEAEASYEKVNFYAKKIKSVEAMKDVAECSSIMALFYLKINKPQKAKEIADHVIAISKQNKEGFNHNVLELSLYKIDSINGNYLSAIEHMKSYNRIQDSMDDISKNRDYENLKFKFETTAKEQNIKSLRQQTNLQKRELHSSRLLNTISISSLLLLLIIIILLYNRAKIKQRSTSRLQLKEKEIKLKNVKLERLVEEKEWLLKEIHHRVKNNLQTVISLLNSQSSYLKDDLAISTIKNSQNRIYAMSLIHQRLYQEDNVSMINMPDYCNELVEYLKESFNAEYIHFEVKIASIELDISQAIAVGLITNEIITNSIKYAFKDTSNCKIRFSLSEVSENCYMLEISDNGIGIPDTTELQNSNSFGMTLINGLSNTLEGDLVVKNENGLSFQLVFKKDFR
ncbi:histidine kinase dimerization/phosphoacceptor domain -containing protein [Flavobacterium sp. LHD-85]|uniref:histidine kinase dimerization/phosphoacceptor domain -containing protein n=1 Tax=Flavobacterium sp. LHD-85 TaxID=3071410 RepID=UPI0027E09713|nr:histidine kinase dimerization/phosphoacceptor domain -containing protein [Flavobacterium sp. LHD-85]MDQ6531146.1 histidine kinase dimerization/phosphoacceptor domain -containing protein [Flavobacterium sp. LHD-85]